MTTSKRILIALTSQHTMGDTGRSTGFWVSEAAEPWQLFRAAGHEVELVSTAGGAPPRDGVDPDAEEHAVGLAEVVPFLLASRLVERGAKHTGAADFEPHVVRDGRLVTGQNPASATGVGEQMLEALAE